MLYYKLEKPTGVNCCWILLTKGKFAIIDRGQLQLVSGFHWIAVRWHRKWYALSYCRTDSTKCRIVMHRLIAKTPPGDLTHHLNRDSLDNRRANLLNVSEAVHKDFHGIRQYHHGKK